MRRYLSSPRLLLAIAVLVVIAALVGSEGPIWP